MRDHERILPLHILPMFFAIYFDGFAIYSGKSLQEGGGASQTERALESDLHTRRKRARLFCFCCARAPEGQRPSAQSLSNFVY